MTLRYLYGAMTTVVACGVVVGPAYGQIRDGGILPQTESGVVTVAGCLVRGNQVRGGQEQKYVLAQPRKGPVESVPQDGCTADPNGNALTLDNPQKGNVTDAMLGKVVEISGRLERETSTNPDNLRELDVATARIVPVVPPRVAVAEPPPAPRPAPTPEPEPAPVATAGQAPAELPKTASALPASGLFGVLALAGALVIRRFRPRE
jgi:hypothetical protein